MESTMEEFIADGGSASFIKALSISLGINASSVKIQSFKVFEGSFTVNYEI
jgi:hypothetical protein